MARIDYPPVHEALERLKDLSADEETRRLAFVRERALRDERSELRGAREEGKAEGKAEGELQASRDILRNVLEDRFGKLPRRVLQKIAKANDAERLKASIRDALRAKSLDDLDL